MSSDFRQILGITFYIGSFEGLLELGSKGGLVVVPSGPGLSELPTHESYRVALEGSTFAITDSGYLVLLWFLFKFERLERISGLRWIRGLVERADFRATGATFWVMPTKADQDANLAYLNRSGIKVGEDACYLAPVYSKGELSDQDLLNRINERRPRYVVLCIGGGVQERLGYYLHRHLDYTPTIVCTGAAIAFLSGRQAAIPVWADRLMLGWLFRLMQAPTKFWRRYVEAIRLAPILWRFGEKSVTSGR